MAEAEYRDEAASRHGVLVCRLACARPGWDRGRCPDPDRSPRRRSLRTHAGRLFRRDWGAFDGVKGRPGEVCQPVIVG